MTPADLLEAIAEAAFEAAYRDDCITIHDARAAVERGFRNGAEAAKLPPEPDYCEMT